MDADDEQETAWDEVGLDIEDGRWRRWVWEYVGSAELGSVEIGHGHVFGFEFGVCFGKGLEVARLED